MMPSCLHELRSAILYTSNQFFAITHLGAQELYEHERSFYLQELYLKTADA